METHVMRTVSNEKRIEDVANRILAYYLQIIRYKKKNGEKTFILDNLHGLSNGQMIKVRLEDKYDGKSRWRDALGMNHEGSDWHTLGEGPAEGLGSVPSFYSIGPNEDGEWKVDIRKVHKRLSILLSQRGIANYITQPKEVNIAAEDYFSNNDEYWLVVCLL